MGPPSRLWDDNGLALREPAVRTGLTAPFVRRIGRVRLGTEYRMRGEAPRALQPLPQLIQDAHETHEGTGQDHAPTSRVEARMPKAAEHRSSRLSRSNFHDFQVCKKRCLSESTLRFGGTSLSVKASRGLLIISVASV